MRILFLASIFCVLTIYSQEQVRLVIFIHGTIGLRHHLSVKTFFNLIRDEVEQTTYKQSINLVRNDPFFYQNQTMQKLGFQQITGIPAKHHAVAPLFARIYEQLDPSNRKIKTVYYTFGWSGLASHKERLKAAYSFYSGFQEVITDIEKEYGVTPITEVVGYSHGATTVLLCEEVRQKLQEDPPFIIDKLMLLGTPVHKETERYICSPLFKKIFHFYSRGDNIQCLDCFSTKRFFSRRRFGHRSYCTLPDSLHQIEVKITNMSHKTLQHRRVNMSPGHMELWFFGWPTTMYRQNFPFYPLPLAVFLPYLSMIAVTECPDIKHVVIELQPDTGCALIRPRHKHRHKRVPFIAPETLERIKKEALQYKPEHFNETLYNAHVHNAIGQAYDLKALRGHRRNSTLCAT